jgi:DNA-binding MarR family transcriptional regulator
MEKRDLVVRIPDKLDRRQNLIYMTNKGKRLQEELMQIFQQTSVEAQEGIDSGQYEIFRKVITEIHHNLSNP